MVDSESTQPIEQKSLSLATQPRLPGLLKVRVRPGSKIQFDFERCPGIAEHASKRRDLPARAF